MSTDKTCGQPSENVLAHSLGRSIDTHHLYGNREEFAKILSVSNSTLACSGSEWLPQLVVEGADSKVGQGKVNEYPTLQPTRHEKRDYPDFPTLQPTRHEKRDYPEFPTLQPTPHEKRDYPEFPTLQPTPHEMKELPTIDRKELKDPKDVYLTKEEREALQKAFTKQVKHNADGTTETTYADNSVVIKDAHGDVVKAQYSDGSGMARMADGSIHHWGKKPQDNYDEVKSADKIIRTYANGCIEETNLHNGSITITLAKGWGEAVGDKIYISANGNSQYMTTYFFRQLSNPDHGKVYHFDSPQEALEAARKKYEFPNN